MLWAGNKETGPKGEQGCSIGSRIVLGNQGIERRLATSKPGLRENRGVI